MNNEDGLPMQPQRPALHRQTLRLCGFLGNCLMPTHTMPLVPLSPPLRFGIMIAGVSGLLRIMKNSASH
jgi:hypothetical protein